MQTLLKLVVIAGWLQVTTSPLLEVIQCYTRQLYADIMKNLSLKFLAAAEKTTKKFLEYYFFPAAFRTECDRSFNWDLNINCLLFNFTSKVMHVLKMRILLTLTLKVCNEQTENVQKLRSHRSNINELMNSWPRGQASLTAKAQYIFVVTLELWIFCNWASNSIRVINGGILELAYNWRVVGY